MSQALANLIIVIILEIILMMTGMALVPIIAESRYKKSININYVMPFFTALGFIVLVGYCALG